MNFTRPLQPVIIIKRLWINVILITSRTIVVSIRGMGDLSPVAEKILEEGFLRFHKIHLNRNEYYGDLAEYKELT